MIDKNEAAEVIDKISYTCKVNSCNDKCPFYNMGDSLGCIFDVLVYGEAPSMLTSNIFQ